MKIKFVLKKSILLSFTILFSSTFLLAENSDRGIFSAIGNMSLFQWSMVAVVFLVILVLGYFWYISELLLRTYARDLKEFKGIETPDKQRIGIFDQLKAKAWRMVPIEKEQTIELDHDYDGIKELDNRLPPWWVYLFYFTIAWGGIYWYVYHWSDIGSSQLEVYHEEEERARYERTIYLHNQANAVNESNVVAIEDEAELANAADTYIKICASCHGPEGQGGVGPNLTDKYWIHGGGIKNIFKTIKYGVPSKGMIAWKEQIQPKTMQKLASYILTLEGTNPPNAKAPQGEIYEEEATE